MKPKCERCALEISGAPIYSDVSGDYEKLCSNCFEEIAPEPPEENDVQNYFERPGCYGEEHK